ncbi:MAG TPA: hypothetical protein VKE24_07690 [Candidatus Acidoferrales bacterium]|nr:hypothetical protein [Candidatus Acidoferrales bacterium]
MEAVVRVNKDRLRKWLWVVLAASIAFQLYFVRELLAALFLFTLAFAVLAGLVAVFYLVDQAGQLSLAWVEPRARQVMPRLRERALGLLEELSKKPFRRLRSQPDQ